MSQVDLAQANMSRMAALFERWVTRDEQYRRRGGLSEAEAETIRSFRLREAGALPADDRERAEIAARKWEPPLSSDGVGLLGVGVGTYPRRVV